MDYSLKIAHRDVFEKTKELIAFRRASADFRLGTRQEISEKLGEVTFDKGNIRYTVGEFLVLHSLSGETAELDGSWEIVYSNIRETYGTVSGSVEVGANESVVLRKVR